MKKFGIGCFLLVVALSTMGVAKLDLGTWGPIIAGFINTILVVIAVNVLKAIWPGLVEKFPWLRTVAAVIIAPALTFLSTWLTGFLGATVDLSPIIGVITGLIAVFSYDVSKGISKGAVTRALARGRGK